MNDTWINRARAQMLARGISHQSLADALGCTRGAVGHYLSGRRGPSLKQLSRIAKALHVSPAWLLHGNGPDGVQEQAAVYGSRNHQIPVVTGVRSGRRSPAAGRLLLPAPERHCYAVAIADDRYSPRIHAGEMVLADPGLKPAAGDEVVLQPRSGRLGIYVCVNSKQGRVVVEPVSGSRERRTFRTKDIRYMHTIIAVFRASGQLR